MAGVYTYILTNKPLGILYVGVTADIADRILAHREGRGSAFCRKWDLRRLVLIEPHPTIEEAIIREKALKNWTRAWKLRLIAETNPEWNDLFDTLNA
jgi:putative endonuclease